MDIELLAAEVGFGRLREAVEQMSRVYREGLSTRSLRLDAKVMAAAYLAVRFPATRAACVAVAEAIGERLPDFAPVSLLDLGAGCGASALGFTDVFGSLREITAMEQMAVMADYGRGMVPAATWRTVSYESVVDLPSHELVLFSYSLGENPERVEANVKRAWAAAEKLLVVVEPGTMGGWGVVKRVRACLLEMGAELVAPCPSGAACPIAKDDWCHFSARLARTSLHRKLKGGELGYEDEKFSYLVASKGPVPARNAGRILRHPLIAPGRIQLDLCEAPGRGLTVVTKANQVFFRVARKAKWGDVWERS
jgi:ribosomal protein RSM22 (predicted rRNA methylase)